MIGNEHDRATHSKDGAEGSAGQFHCVPVRAYNRRAGVVFRHDNLRPSVVLSVRLCTRASVGLL